ncbi:MAG: methylated-DNA-[protein]-cysteine S-methyltransferase [Candidatus Peregrinibacteria bacterium Gr01-1014_25]|nr:MAG: methylated-DNA-[protein]-cysteine S-methyltransferase [Candidatus Peregrinibacteria bacterium Gr01-1014_25]
MPTVESLCSIDSPIGCLRLRAVERGMVAIDIGAPAEKALGEQFAFLRDCARQLTEYFAGARRVFADVPIALRGTSFQLDVWNALERVRFGETITYGALGSRLDCGSARAIGQALTRNPLPIIVPCHRVVAADGDIGGYACGVAAKRWLLDHEAAR